MDDLKEEMREKLRENGMESDHFDQSDEYDCYDGPIGTYYDSDLDLSDDAEIMRGDEDW